MIDTSTLTDGQLRWLAAFTLINLVSLFIIAVTATGVPLYLASPAYWLNCFMTGTLLREIVDRRRKAKQNG